MRLETDERIEAIKSLNKVHQFIRETRQDVYNWKWAIIALHNSAQAFMILALQGTAAFNVCDNRRKFLEAIYYQRELPNRLFLQNFLSLYKDIKSADRMNNSAFSGSKETDEAMERLNEFRNKFIHFIPGVWCLEVRGMLELCKSVLSVIEFLIFESGNIRFYDNEELEKVNLAELISEIRSELKSLEIEHEKI